MKFCQLIKKTIIYSCLLFSTASMAMLEEGKLPTQFSGSTETSTLRMDFRVVNDLLHAGVLKMGYSTRGRAHSSRARLGTRMKQFVDTYTENESNRFFYETLKKDQAKILKLRNYLENIPAETPLNLYSKNEQLAYWLNLYNVTLINEIAKIYPKNDLKRFLANENSILTQKILNVNGISLSLHDIQYNILLNKYKKNPLVIYGLYQGVIGGPSIRTKAYTGSNVISALKDNAFEFINSNRGTQFNGSKDAVRVSIYYKQNAAFFPNFNNDLKKHLAKFAKKDITDDILQAETFETDIKNWRVTDLYGSIHHYEGAVASNPIDDRAKLPYEQALKLQHLMRVRAINFGSGSVTVTDLEDKK